MTLLPIGQAARLAGVSVQALRYYERRGILRPTTRRASGYRVYSPDAIERLRALRWLQRLGFSLREAASLLRVPQLHSRGMAAQARRLALRKDRELRLRVQSLQRVRRLLQRLAACHCDGNCRFAEIAFSRSPRANPLTRRSI